MLNKKMRIGHPDECILVLVWMSIVFLSISHAHTSLSTTRTYNSPAMIREYIQRLGEQDVMWYAIE